MNERRYRSRRHFDDIGQGVRVGAQYELDEHRHNVAVWAAARAAQRALLGFNVKAADAAIKACDLQRISSDWRNLPVPNEFDGEHNRWCKAAMGSLSCSHGRAAKLINMYLKLRIVCGPAGEDADRPKVGAIHPPIDRQLLNGLARQCLPDEAELRRELAGLASLGWTQFKAEDYRAAIKAVGEWLRRRGENLPLWQAEQVWKGY
jgi:hypothetical protein